MHFDDNGFLVRPAPVGAVVNGTIRTHHIQAYYLGWTSNGHIGWLNVSHAFYQALGHDDFNTIAGRRVDINARMGALELSVDHDWARYRASFFYSSGDSSNRSGASRTDGLLTASTQLWTRPILPARISVSGTAKVCVSPVQELPW